MKLVIFLAILGASQVFGAPRKLSRFRQKMTLCERTLVNSSRVENARPADPRIDQWARSFGLNDQYVETPELVDFIRENLDLLKTEDGNYSGLLTNFVYSQFERFEKTTDQSRQNILSSELIRMSNGSRLGLFTPFTEDRFVHSDTRGVTSLTLAQQKLPEISAQNLSKMLEALSGSYLISNKIAPQIQDEIDETLSQLSLSIRKTVLQAKPPPAIAPLLPVALIRKIGIPAKSNFFNEWLGEENSMELDIRLQNDEIERPRLWSVNHVNFEEISIDTDFASKFGYVLPSMNNFRDVLKAFITFRPDALKEFVSRYGPVLNINNEEELAYEVTENMISDQELEVFFSASNIERQNYLRERLNQLILIPSDLKKLISFIMRIHFSREVSISSYYLNGQIRKFQQDPQTVFEDRVTKWLSVNGWKLRFPGPIPAEHWQFIKPHPEFLRVQRQKAQR